MLGLHIWTYCLMTFFTLVKPHDIHVSKAEVHYKSDVRAVQLTINIFIDDLELALSRYSDDEMKLFSPQESALADSLIQVYLNQHFQIGLDEQVHTAFYIGKEISDDLSAAWCYMELENIGSFSTLSLNNTLLLEEFGDQRNIVSFKKDKKRLAFEIMDKSFTHKDIKY